MYVVNDYAVQSAQAGAKGCVVVTDLIIIKRKERTKRNRCINVYVVPFSKLCMCTTTATTTVSSRLIPGWQF